MRFLGCIFMLRYAIFCFSALFLMLVCFPVTNFSKDYIAVFFEIENTYNAVIDDSSVEPSEPRRHFIEERSGLFAYPGAFLPISQINPQSVIVLDEIDNWILIDTWLGEKWVDLNFRPPTDDLDASLSRHGSSISVFFKNLESGFIYTYNPERVYFGASLNKINHALYTFVLAERGYISMETVHTFAESDRRGGTGQIQHMEAGTRFTTRELLRHSMIHSCNVAARMLIRYTNTAAFTYYEFVHEVGTNPEYIGNIATQNTDLFDKALWMNAVNEYIWSDGVYSLYFRADLMATPGFIRADYPMARKYGWATGAFHDAAVVYAPSPYILIIMTTRSDNGGAPGLLRDISYLFQDFNRAWFG